LLIGYLSGCANARPATRPASADRYLRQPGLFKSFDPNARELSVVNAYLLQLAARAGDCESPSQSKLVRGWGFQQHRQIFDRLHSAYAYVASDERMVLVAFCGTDPMNLRDMQSDAAALWPKHDDRYCVRSDAVVHPGFSEALDSIWDGLCEEVLAQARRPTDVNTSAPTQPSYKPVWITGHSRGGAFALLAASGFSQLSDFPTVAGVYTFGQPKVGNAAFAQAFDATGVPYFRFVTAHDAVAGQPVKLPKMTSDYAHAGTMAYFDDSGTLRRNPPESTLSLWRVDPDHYQAQYQLALYSVLRQPERIEDSSWRTAANGADRVKVPKPYM
jgi:hypothetical protein